ncbi:hypothetical protein CLG96_03530 [Sphingomonas oleivorans]|uniref:DUF2867 domain-containing protein n=1 Tax=Sphingomonas oleivorans TaxID=1735121 RepID=A0A2T5G228_9SPHN|nr:DUF2867 domain-containing protein [Sphingomonas oleivorans]PTQ13204.1 hypothetical protein CLG96_03530 [Sphingomonas oleivorans]
MHAKFDEALQSDFINASKSKECFVRPFAVSIPKNCEHILPSVDFCDAFAIDTPVATLSAPQAAQLAFSRPPGWIAKLLAIRNVLVSPFGLKSGAEADLSDRPRIGLPVFSSSPERVVLGLDDIHLNFRLIVDVTNLNDTTCRVIATTLVQRNNLLGRIYLATVLPFHRILVPALLAPLARPQSGLP